MSKPNVLFVMADQMRFDTIAALGAADIYTPNLDRLVKRGVTFTNAYSTCPVCMPARYTIRSGGEPTSTGIWTIMGGGPWNTTEDEYPFFSYPGAHDAVRERLGPYLAETMRDLGYRTFGVGKFHTDPWDAEVGYDVQLYSEELYADRRQRDGDAYAAFIAREHPEFDFIENLMGERTEMYYVPQMSPMPAEFTVEAWAARNAVDLIRAQDGRPWFGFVSFVGPHPPLAPPIPFNRLYDPDRMASPVLGDPDVDHMDSHLPWMNHFIFAEDVSPAWARMIRARYFGEITYIDHCLGLILDSVEMTEDAENTLICFFSDHGELLGDHHSWQKESFFEASCHVPFLLSWPWRVPAGETRSELVSLADAFGIATGAAGALQTRDGCDLLGVLEGRATPRQRLFGFYGFPGSRTFKLMVREGAWKYIFLCNGGREQLFHLGEDPQEVQERSNLVPEVSARLRAQAVRELERTGITEALDGGDLKQMEFEMRPLQRAYQFDRARGITGFPEHPRAVLDGFSLSERGG